MLPPAAASYPLNVPDVLIATDSPSVYADIGSTIQEPGVILRWTRSGRAVVPGLLERPADLVVSDLQIGSMGGYSIAMDIALEAGAGPISPCPCYYCSTAARMCSWHGAQLWPGGSSSRWT